MITSGPSADAERALEPFNAAAKRVERVIASAIDFSAVLDMGCDLLNFLKDFPHPTKEDWEDQYVHLYDLSWRYTESSQLQQAWI
jgi:hypothetical protein